MKHILILLLACWAASARAIGTYAPGDVLHVLAYHGLSLRSGPSTGHAKRATLPYGTKITVLDSVRVKPFSVKEYPGYTIRGHWTKVRFDTLEGYVFDGYLSRYSAPRSNGRGGFEDFLTYATREFGTPKKQKLELESDKPCSDCSSFREIYTFKNGVVYELHAGDGDGGWTVPYYQLPGLSFEEAFLWFVYNDGLYKDDPKYNKPGLKPEELGFEISEQTPAQLSLYIEICDYIFERKGKVMFIRVKCSC